jgi:hypothetical protein
VKTVSVPVLDDAHDEAEETLTFRLSNAAGMRIADGEATGTILNTEPESAPVVVPVEAGLDGLTVSPVPGDPYALDVSWAAVEWPLEYFVQWKTDGQEYELDESDYTLERFFATKATSYRIKNLAPNTTYTVKVIARLLGDDAEPYAEVRRTLPALRLQAVEVRPNYSMDDVLSVRWQKMSGVSAYRVEYKKGTDPATRFTVQGIHSVGALGSDSKGNHGVSWDGLDPGTTYTVRVIALHGTERHEIGYGEATGRTRDTFGPVAVSAVPDHGDQLDVSWSSPAEGQPYTYLVSYKETGSTDACTGVTRADPKALTERITGLSNNTGYTVKVEARFPLPSLAHPDRTVSAGEAEGTATPGSPSSGESGSQESQEAVGAAALGGLTVAAVSGKPTQLLVSWDEVQDASTYGVRWKTGAEGYSDPVEFNETRYIITGLSANTAYTVNVAALDADNTLLAEGTESGTTEPATSKAKAAVPAAPRIVIYHDPSAAVSVTRYNTAVGLLKAASRSYAVRTVSGTDEVDRLAGVSN